MCSRSDEVIRRVADDKDLGIVTAKKNYRETAENAVANELRRAKVPEKAIKELMGFCVSINKNDLRALISQDQTQWPKELGDYEIHERGLLRFLARITP
jgi:hypothetical protein